MKLAVAVRDLASVPLQPENVPVVGRLLDLGGMADDGVPLAKLALQERGDGPAARIEVPALAAYLQRAKGRNVQRSVPDLDAGDDRDAVEERPSLESWEPRLFAVPLAAKKVTNGFVGPLESAALDGDRTFGHIRHVPPALGQHPALVETGYATADLPVAVDPFLQGVVAELALVL